MPRAREDARRHPELNLADRAHCLARALDEPLHLGGGSAGALRMRVAREEDQKRISSELQDVAATAVRDPDQTLEDAADREHELLGARAPLRLEPLGERSEAREVDGDERPVELARRLGRSMRRPVDSESRQVRLERSAWHGVHTA